MSSTIQLRAILQGAPEQSIIIFTLTTTYRLRYKSRHKLKEADAISLTKHSEYTIPEMDFAYYYMHGL